MSAIVCSLAAAPAPASGYFSKNAFTYENVCSTDSRLLKMNRLTSSNLVFVLNRPQIDGIIRPRFRSLKVKRATSVSQFSLTYSHTILSPTRFAAIFCINVK